MNRNNIKLGAFYMLISVTGFSIMDIAVKWTTADYSIGNTSDRVVKLIQGLSNLKNNWLGIDNK